LGLHCYHCQARIAAGIGSDLPALMLGRKMADNTVPTADKDNDNRKIKVAAEAVFVVSHSLS
jgi:hypothetical protein